jgi:glycosyltransferase involved in cell wall biosynthesis
MQEVDEAADRPRLSFGLPVRNGERFLRRAFDSFLAQDCPDFEVVVCDNQSDDATEAICREFAERDPRFRYFRNDADIGQIENFNRVFQLSRGEYFRWIGADDWVEPSYTRKCVNTLDANPAAVGVTTLWQLVDDDGAVEFEEYVGPRVDSPRARERLARLLWFLQPRRNRLFFDPIYSALRRNALERTSLLPIDPWTDRYLAVELCLIGPFCHVHERLASRRKAREGPAIRLSRYHQQYDQKGFPPIRTMYAGFAAIIRKQALSPLEKATSCLTVLFHWLKAEWNRPYARVAGAVSRRLVRGEREG